MLRTGGHNQSSMWQPNCMASLVTNHSSDTSPTGRTRFSICCIKEEHIAANRERASWRSHSPQFSPFQGFWVAGLDKGLSGQKPQLALKIEPTGRRGRQWQGSKSYRLRVICQICWKTNASAQHPLWWGKPWLPHHSVLCLVYGGGGMDHQLFSSQLLSPHQLLNHLLPDIAMPFNLS